MIYPSARSDISCHFESGELIRSSGWNLVDYRGAPPINDCLRFVQGTDGWRFLPPESHLRTPPAGSEYAGSFKLEGSLPIKMPISGRSSKTIIYRSENVAAARLRLGYLDRRGLWFGESLAASMAPSPPGQVLEDHDMREQSTREPVENSPSHHQSRVADRRRLWEVVTNESPTQDLGQRRSFWQHAYSNACRGPGGPPAKRWPAASLLRHATFRLRGQGKVTLIGLLRDGRPTEALFRGPARLGRHSGA